MSNLFSNSLFLLFKIYINFFIEISEYFDYQLNAALKANAPKFAEYPL